LLFLERPDLLPAEDREAPVRVAPADREHTMGWLFTLGARKIEDLVVDEAGRLELLEPQREAVLALGPVPLESAQAPPRDDPRWTRGAWTLRAGETAVYRYDGVRSVVVAFRAEGAPDRPTRIRWRVLSTGIGKATLR